jgi:hypothetical protein
LDAKVKPASPKSSELGRQSQAGLVGLNLISSQAQAKPLQAKTKRLGSRLGLFERNDSSNPISKHHMANPFLILVPLIDPKNVRMTNGQKMSG